MYHQPYHKTYTIVGDPASGFTFMFMAHCRDELKVEPLILKIFQGSTAIILDFVTLPLFLSRLIRFFARGFGFFF